MVTRRRSILSLAFMVGVLLAAPAQASFHLMQIEQVIGGINGDVTAQAIQLRMRSAGQNLVGQSRINARDAAGLNPILIVDMTTNVANGLSGDRVLIASPTFQSNTSPVLTPDFTMTNLIPASYLAAGSLTFEADTGTIYWRLSWGGAGYTGAGNMSALNDNTANSNPPFAGSLPSTSLEAIKFTGLASAGSITGASDYLLTAGASMWANNARLSSTVVTPVGVGDPPPRSSIDLIQLSRSYPNPTHGPAQVSFALQEAGHVNLSIYSASGGLVRELIDTELASGPHQTSWDGLTKDGSQVASGVYFYRLEALGQSRTTRFVEAR